jgi:phosphatidylinositol transfer protein SFH5
MSNDETNQVTPQPVPETHLTEKTQATPAIIAVQEEKHIEEPPQLVSKEPQEATTNDSTGDRTAEDHAAESKPAEAVTSEPDYLTKNTALSQFFSRLPVILEKTGHGEMWGVSLKDSRDPPTANVIIKFLRANEGNVNQAEEQLTKALEWRKKLDPLSLAEKSRFSASKFGGLGYITTYNDQKSGELIFNWNIYGSVKKIDATFGDIDE